MAPASAPASVRQVLLFAGHRVDPPGRRPPRFPAALEAPARAAIEDVLQRLDAGAQDLALTQGAAGGDLLFAEACQRRGVPLRLMLPLPEPEFARASLLPSADGRHWLRRFHDVAAGLPRPPQVLPPAAPGAPGNAFERCNEWMLRTARAEAGALLQFVCLWDGGDGDGCGGTRHMVDAVRRAGGRVHWIDTRTLWAGRPGDHR